MFSIRSMVSVSLGKVVGVALLAGCAGNGSVMDPGPQPLAATAELRDAAGTVVGTATLVQEASRPVALEVTVRGLSAGPHGIHLHAVGACEAPQGSPAFASAGGHFNPAGRAHGLENPQGAHGGDLPNLEVAADGRGQIRVTSDRITLSEGALSLFDADGSAIVIHAGPDDQKSDPAGNSGARVACGRIELR